MKRFPSHLVPTLIATVAIGILWLCKGASDQELLANTSKALDFHPWNGWWSPLFLGGGSQAPGLTTGFSYLILKAFILPFGVIFGAKLAALTAAFLGGLGVAAFLKRWTGDETAAWLGSVAYILGPQMALRLGANEHLPVVFAMVFAPWILWALFGLAKSPTWQRAFMLAILSAGMTVTFTKLAVVFAPLALLFTVYLCIEDRSSRDELIKWLGRSLLVFLPLAVLPLLPTLREMHWLAMFQFDPFESWQQNFSLKSVLSWLDRGNELQQGMPPGYTADLGGFYVGFSALIFGLLAWWSASRTAEKEKNALLNPLKLVFGALLFLSWMSAGPRCIAQGALEFLRSAQGVADFTIPLFWVVSVAQCVLLWKIWPVHPHRDLARIAALLVYLGVPGFRLYELFPFAHDIRAPWSFWQAGGSFVVASLFGIAGSLLIKSAWARIFPAGGIALILLLLLGGDYSVYLMRYATGALPEGTYPAFEQICSQLKQAPDNGSIFPLSGRYFYLQLPSLTGKPIEQEAFNGYFGLTWRRALQNASMASIDSIRTGLSLLGCSYIFIDKQDPNTPKDLQKTFQSIFPTLIENEFFVVLTNPQSFYPGFLAHNFVVLPRDSFAMAPAALQLAPQNLVTLELDGIDPSMPGFAGAAKGANQIELQQKYQGHGGEPFDRIPLQSYHSNNGDNMSFQIPPTASGWLISTMAYHPDWTVTIDGHPSQIKRAEVALLSTFVPLGSHEVVFQFEAPEWYSLSLNAGILSWMIALVALIYLPSKLAPDLWRRWWNGLL